MNNKLFAFTLLTLKLNSAFSQPNVVCLKDILMQRIFSEKQWATYKPMLIKNISNIPSELFENRTFKTIDFRGVPLQGKCFKECKFVDVDFRNMDLSETRFEKCKFKRVKIDGVFLKKDEFFFKDSMPHIELIEKYSNSMILGDLFKLNNFNEQAQKCYDVAQILNNFIFKAINIKLYDLPLKNLNLKGIHLEKATLKKVNFENCNLQEAQFHHSQFIDVRLENADLTTTIFNKTKLTNVSLNHAILCEGFKLKPNLDNEGYIHLYNKLKSKGKNQKAQALNKILPSLYLNLKEKNLSSLNLSGIDLSNANLAISNLSYTDLTDANLNNANLSHANIKQIKLSNTLTIHYQTKNDLFHQWINASKEDKPFYQKLVNARFNLFKDLSNQDFITFFNNRDQAQTLDLRNANFNGAKLQNVNFENVNLKNSDLAYADLIKANFRKANLKNVDFFFATLMRANLTGAKLSKIKSLKNANLDLTKFSETLTFNSHDTCPLFYAWTGPQGKDQKICQYLVNLGVNIFKDISHQELKNYFDQRDHSQILDLTNANLSETDLHDINFKGVILKGANLEQAELKGSHLAEVNLSGARLSPNYILPESYSDQDLLDSYKSNNPHLNENTKKTMKIVLILKGLLPQSGESTIIRLPKRSSAMGPYSYRILRNSNAWGLFNIH